MVVDVIVHAAGSADAVVEPVFNDEIIHGHVGGSRPVAEHEPAVFQQIAFFLDHRTLDVGWRAAGVQVDLAGGGVVIPLALLVEGSQVVINEIAPAGARSPTGDQA